MAKKPGTDKPLLSQEEPAGEFQFRWRDMVPERQDRRAVKIRTTADKKDLKKLIDFAKMLGARDGLAIKAEKIVTSEVIRLKCRIPTCWGYNSSFSCPPHSAKAGEMRAIIDEYEWALLLSIPPPDGASSSSAEPSEHMNKLKEIVGRTEVEAQYKGYLRAMGFTGGPCTLCGVFGPEWIQTRRKGKEANLCPLLTRELPFCTHYYHCRPAAQAVGIDMYLTAKNVRWEEHLYPPPPVVPRRIDWPCLPGVYPILIV
jgi:predicted metal-binding protein